MTLSKAFTQTQTDEWVVFGLTRSGSQRFTELTGGGGYVDGFLLHIVLPIIGRQSPCPVRASYWGAYLASRRWPLVRSGHVSHAQTEPRGYGDRRGWWDKCFEELLTYKAQHGDYHVPNRWAENRSLAYWINNQRGGKAGRLSLDRQRRLDALEFEWIR